MSAGVVSITSCKGSSLGVNRCEPSLRFVIPMSPPTITRCRDCTRAVCRVKEMLSTPADRELQISSGALQRNDDAVLPLLRVVDDFANIESFPENVLASAGTGDDNVHQYQHQIVMPSESLFSPETGVPNKDLLLDRSQHDQNQTNRRELREYTKRDSQPSGEFRDTEKHRKRPIHTYTLSPLLWIFNIGPAAGHKHCRHHQSQQQQAEVGELGELWKHPLSSLPFHRNISREPRA